MNKKRSSILVLILLLVIGFAAVSTTLVINGTLNINGNADDFDVYFSAATITDGGTVTGVGTKTLTFSTQTLKSVNETSAIDYTVYNDSTEYDADVTISCVASTTSDYFTVTSTFDGESVTNVANTSAITMAAQEKKNGKIVIKQIKAYAEEDDLSVTYTCTINAIPASKSTIVDKVWTLSNDADSDGEADVGDLITIGTESFYVISNDGTNIKALAQYNLYVGGYYYDGDDGSSNYIKYGEEATGLQNSTMIGWNTSGASSSNPYKGVTAFSNTSNKYSGSIVEGYVDTYVEYLNSMNADITASSLITKEELNDLGCSTSSHTCSESPYAWTYSSSYWVGSGTQTKTVWRVSTNADFYDNVSCTFAYTYGVRPVITISVYELK